MKARSTFKVNFFVFHALKNTTIIVPNIRWHVKIGHIDYASSS